MYLEFYGLREEPFGVTPDPRFLYLSPDHREALASIYYGIEAGRGFMALIAVPGMGKTTLLFHLLERFRSSARTAFLFQTQCSSRDFMRFLMTELSLESGSGQDPVAMHDEFNRLLLQEARAGRRCIVIVDEAQNLDPQVLETIRLLSDFETPRAKLLQIVLAGQPELADKLARPSLAQLRQRISLIGRLSAMPVAEIRCYVEHRLKVAGANGEPLFSDDAYLAIAELSMGIPRNINNLCFNSLSLGFALRQKNVNAELVREAAADFDLSRLLSQHPANDPLHELVATSNTDHANQLASVLNSQRGAAHGNGNGNGKSAATDDALSLMEAKEYMQRIIQLLRDGSPVPDQTPHGVGRL